MYDPGFLLTSDSYVEFESGQCRVSFLVHIIKLLSRKIVVVQVPT